jgi:hypothetical protein
MKLAKSHLILGSKSRVSIIIEIKCVHNNNYIIQTHYIQLTAHLETYNLIINNDKNRLKRLAQPRIIGSDLSSNFNGFIDYSRKNFRIYFDTSLWQFFVVMHTFLLLDINTHISQLLFLFLSLFKNEMHMKNTLDEIPLFLVETR